MHFRTCAQQQVQKAMNNQLDMTTDRDVDRKAHRTRLRHKRPVHSGGNNNGQLHIPGTDAEPAQRMWEETTTTDSIFRKFALAQDSSFGSKQRRLIHIPKGEPGSTQEKARQLPHSGNERWANTTRSGGNKRGSFHIPGTGTEPTQFIREKITTADSIFRKLALAQHSSFGRKQRLGRKQARQLPYSGNGR